MKIKLVSLEEAKKNDDVVMGVKTDITFRVKRLSA